MGKIPSRAQIFRQAGKGDKRRPGDEEAYRKNYAEIDWAQQRADAEELEKRQEEEPPSTKGVF